MKKVFFIIFSIIVVTITWNIRKIEFNKTKIESEKKMEESQKVSEEYTKKIEGMKVTLIGGTNMKKYGAQNSCGYVIRTRNNKLIIVDGGRERDSEFVLKYINKYGNGKVDYWYITHPHSDHVGALIKLLNEENIEIENLCYSFNSDEWYKKYDKRGYEAEYQMINSLNNEKIKNKIECQKNQIIYMDNISCEILKVANPEITNSDNGNDSSMVFKMTATDVDKSILFLGDAYKYASEELLENPNKLSSFAVQMAHHGQNGVSKEVYDAINPTICFFNAPEWLYNNDNGNGYNSGKWQSVIVREWMKEKQTTNFVAFEGDKTIRFTKDGFEEIEE